MAAVINTNYLSLVAQNNLNKSQSALGTAIERLSSGLRINSAKDDAAGLAIANRFTANVRGLTQAARNSNDGISLAQTTEGATSEISVHLQRIRELTVQSQNGTYSPDDLASLQAEIDQRLADIDRISQQTDFNGVKVLSQNQSLTIQVGARDGETITIDLSEISAETLGLGTFSVTGTTSAANLEGATALTELAPPTLDVSELTFSDANTAAAYSVAASTEAGVYYVVDADDNVYSATYDAVRQTFVFDTSDGTVNVDVADLTVDPTYVYDGSTAIELSTLADPVNEAAVDKEVYGDTEGNLFVKVGDNYYDATVGADGVLSYDSATASFSEDDIDADSSFGGPLTEVATGESGVAISLTGVTLTNPELLQGKDGKYILRGQNADGETVYHSATVDQDTGAVTQGDLLTLDPLAKLDAALNKLDTMRSDLGAIQNRLESTVSNLNNVVNNLSASRSRIEDADYAVEVSNMTRAQILQQAGTSVLAQSNQVPQTVLSLLG